MKAHSSNSLTIDGNASEQIDGYLNTDLKAQYASLTVVCDGSAWHVISVSGESVVASYAPSTDNAVDTQFVNITSVSLAPGVWLVSGIAHLSLATATIVSNQVALSQYSGNTTTDHTAGDNVFGSVVPTSSFDTSVAIPNWRVSTTSSTVVYLKAYFDFTGGNKPSMGGRITATRIR